MLIKEWVALLLHWKKKLKNSLKKYGCKSYIFPYKLNTILIYLKLTIFILIHPKLRQFLSELYFVIGKKFYLCLINSFKI